ncbi:peptide/nickel transport system substrate-binding protein [Lysinibacillus composti]|uniref:ABC transporter substrate-binding protein n=1 Tax=Lysinibacillus composti TaxID=720633 RepID=A0A3N9UPM9_9BACI|nr:ABC transporter substrate-binding protein [Lysinibacillus composti]MBM7608903.1 peptide/nickel transport system substrate-binding protein [Lysinibacillus composti]RQW74482.1 ABC transporter substrate-binding protein [Lysinibacillus composti]
MKAKKISLFMAIISLVLIIAGCSGGGKSSSTTTTSGASEGGALKEELHYASNAQPPSLDPLMSNAVVTREVASIIYESLVAFDENYEPVPMLAESIEQSEDGKTYTFKLRQGVKFHNGKEMKAEDVVASLTRWAEKSSSARAVLVDPVFAEVDEYTVTLTLGQGTTLALGALANVSHLAAIMPKEIVESAPESGVTEFIGTGPYKFVEWKQDQYLKFTKFDDYVALDTPASGLSGKKEALVKDVYYDIVLDPSTQLTGVQTGEYDIAGGILQDDLAQVEANKDLAHITPFSMNYSILLNRKEGPFTSKEMRQAVSLALDHDSLAAVAAVGNYTISPSLMPKHIEKWSTEAGAEFFNQKDTEKAKSLLKEAGYNGETVTILTTRDYPVMYNEAVAMKEQLGAIGINVELLVYDWATALAEVRSSPEDWDLFTTSFPGVPSPAEMLYFAEGYFDGAESDTQKELLAKIRSAATHEEAKQYWEELQTHSIEDVKIITTFGLNAIHAYSNKVDGYKYFDVPVFWNVKVAE